MCVCSRTPRARASSADSRISSCVTENGEQGASAIRTIASGEVSWKRSIASLQAARIASRSSTTSSGGSPPLDAAEVHRAAARVEAQPDLARRLDLDLQQVAGVAREEVVVVGGGRAARAGERDEPGAGGGLLDRGVDVRPDRIELLEPLEQRVVLREPARGPLVEVVVAVDEPGRGEQAAAVDPDLLLVARRRRAGADLVDEAVADDDVPVAVLAAGVVDRRDRAALDDQAGHRAAARTASRIFS